MDGREHDLHLLHLTGDERAAFEEKRWVFVFMTLPPLVGMTATYVVQLTQAVQEPFVVYTYPILAPLMLGSLLWNLMGGYSRIAERLTVAVLAALTLLHNVSFALHPTLPESVSFVGSASYWTLVLDASVILLLLPVRRAAVLIAALYVLCVALPWTVNFDEFRPYAAAMVRTQGNTLSILLALVCLAWYRQRYVDRAREALMLRQLVTTDFFASPGATAAVETAGGHERSVPVRP